MDIDQDQERFRVLFSEQKRADERATPSFERVMRRAEEAHGGGSSWPMLRLAAAVMLCATGIGAVVLVGHYRGHRQIALPTPVRPATNHNIVNASAVAIDAPIADWQSPTAFLLDISADEAEPFGASTQPSAPPVTKSGRSL